MQRDSYEQAEAQAKAVVASPTVDPHICGLAQAIATLAAALRSDLALIERRLDRLEIDARKS